MIYKIHRPIKIFVIAFPPDRRIRNLDNLWKALLDTLARVGVYEDDDQIADKRIKRDRVVPGGKVIVTIQEIAKENT